MYRSEAREKMELGRNTRDSVWLWAREWVLRGTNSDGNPLRAFIREVICVRCSREKKITLQWILLKAILDTGSPVRSIT